MEKEGELSSEAYYALCRNTPSIVVEENNQSCEEEGKVVFLTRHPKKKKNSNKKCQTVQNSKSAIMESLDSDSAEYIDDWEVEHLHSSTTSEENSLQDSMVKTSPTKEGQTDRKSSELLENNSIWMKYRDQCEHSAICLRDPDPEVRIVDTTLLEKKKIRLKKKIQNYIYNFLERPTGIKCFTYHMIVFVMVLACLIFSVLSTVEPTTDELSPILLTMETCVVVFFGIEYCVRLWAAGSIGKYSGFYGRLRFARKPICMIDFVVVIASTVVLLCSQNGNVFATSAIRGIRFIQILRMLHMDRQGGTWRLLGSVVYVHRQELITTLYIGFLALILSSYFVYLAEKRDRNDEDSEHSTTALNYSTSECNDNRFNNYADALWWGVITVTTIGYGDFVPKTWLGKVVASCFSIFAISFFALPAGILGSGFALKVQQKQRQKQFNRQIPAAANLIQAYWRCYATRRGSTCKATWNIYALLSRTRYDSTSAKVGSLKPRKENGKSKSVTDNDAVTKATSPSSWNDVIGKVITGKENGHQSLPDAYKNVVRALRVLVYLARKKEFHRCRKPYDVRDVFEQYSHGYVNITCRLKELQRRMDQTLGKPASFIDDVPGSQDRQRVTAGFRLRRLEGKINAIEDKLDELLKRLPPLEVTTGDHR